MTTKAAGLLVCLWWGSVIVLTLAVLSLAGCGDDEPSAAELCAKSCEERGGEFYQMQGEYCYCAWTQ